MNPGFRVPSIEELKNEAKRLLTEVIKNAGNEYKFIETGGLRAEFFPDRQEDALTLSFIIESMGADNEL